MKDKLALKVTDFSRIVLYVIATGILIWLNIYSFEMFDALIAAVLVVISVAVGMLLEKLVCVKKYAERIVLGICCTAFGLMCMWWVSAVPYYISGDQAIIWQASALALENDFSMYALGGQMFIYPQQQGLAFLYELLFRITGSDSPRMIGYISAVLAPFTLFFGYQCVKECGGTKAAVRFLPLMMVCMPYIIYSPYVYGDIPSVCYSFILFWAVLKYIKQRKLYYGIIACLVAALALLSRMNMWIFFIGLTIGLLYTAWKKWSWKPVILAVCIMLCASFSMSGVKQFNSMRSGYPVSKGMPSILWMTMGFQYSDWGAGYYNNYSKGVFIETGFDREASIAIAKQEIKDRAQIFMAYPEQIGMFFREKLCSQWHDSLFEATKSTGTLDTTEYMHPLAEWVYQGEGQRIVRQISSRIMSVIYLFSIIGVGFRFFKKKDILQDVPLIVIVGGFLFSIIWEAKSRYMLPYYILLHMYAAYGLTDVSEMLVNRISDLQKGIKK